MASSITLSPPRSLSLFPTTLSHSSDPHRHFILLHFHLHRIYPRIHASRRISNFPQEGPGIEEYEDGDDDEEEEEEEEDRSLDLLVKFVENVFKKISRKARKAVRSVLPVTISTKLVGFSVNGVILLAFLWVLKAFLEVNHPKSKVPFNDRFAFAVETGRILYTIFCAFLFKAILNKWDPNTGGFQQAEFQNGILFANSIIIAQEVIYLVVCTIGSVVFVSILFIRGIWSGLSYLQQSRNYRANEFDDDKSCMDWRTARILISPRLEQ